MTNRKGFSGLSHSSKKVVLPSGPKTYSVKKRTLAFSPSKPGETLNNNSGYTSSLQTRKQTRSTLWKELPTTKEIGRWTTIWIASKPWSLTLVIQIPGHWW